MLLVCIRMLLVCIRMLLVYIVFHSYTRICTRMYPYATWVYPAYATRSTRAVF